MSIVSWIVLGALSGWLASIIMKKNEQMGAFANISIGIIGAFIGGVLMNLIVGVGITGFNLWSVLVSVVGAVILLWIVNMIRGRV